MVRLANCACCYRRSLLTLVLPEFRTFVQETERELLTLFKSIDYNEDGKITKPELRAALSRAGMAVPNSSLDNFFSEVDTNNDGHISFEEWRYVLLMRLLNTRLFADCSFGDALNQALHRRSSLAC